MSNNNGQQPGGYSSWQPNDDAHEAATQQASAADFNAANSQQGSHTDDMPTQMAQPRAPYTPQGGTPSSYEAPGQQQYGQNPQQYGQQSYGQGQPGYTSGSPTYDQGQTYGSSHGQGSSQPNYGQPNYGSSAPGQPEGAQQYASNPQYGSNPSDAQQYGSAGQQYGQQGYGSGAGNQAYGQPSAPQYGQNYPSGDQNQAFGQAPGQQQFGAYPGQPGQGAYGQAGAMAGALGFASWGSRVGAYLIDNIIPIIVGAVLGLMAVKSGQNPDGSTWIDINPGLMTASFLFTLLFRFANEGYLQGKTGQSFGKKALKIAVVDKENGSPIGVGRGCFRLGLDVVVSLVGQFLQYVVLGLGSLVGLVMIVNYLWPLWDKQNQTWWDKIVKSYVVKKAA